MQIRWSIRILFLPDFSGNGKYPTGKSDKSFSAMGLGSGSSNSIMSSTMSTDVFHEMPEDADLYKDQYDVKAGRWPENYKECVLVLTSQGDISDFLQYTLGLRDGKELDDMVQKFMAEEAVETPENEGPYTS